MLVGIFQNRQKTALQEDNQVRKLLYFCIYYKLKLVFVVVVFVLLDFRREKHDFMQPAVIIKSYLSPCSLLTKKFL